MEKHSMRTLKFLLKVCKNFRIFYLKIRIIVNETKLLLEYAIHKSRTLFPLTYISDLDKL